MKKVYKGIVAAFFIFFCGAMFYILKDIQIDEMQETIMFEKLKKGDFSALSESRTLTQDEIERIYQIQQNDSNVEWVQSDINGDGCEDFIWQEKDALIDGIKRIVGIFTMTKDGTKIENIVWDVNDSTEFFFSSDAGKLVYYTQQNGIYNYRKYNSCEFDKVWEKNLAYALAVYEIYDMKEVNVIDWGEIYPDMAEEGIYYIKYELNSEQEVLGYEQLSLDSFELEYEKLVGRKFIWLE